MARVTQHGFAHKSGPGIVGTKYSRLHSWKMAVNIWTRKPLRPSAYVSSTSDHSVISSAENVPGQYWTVNTTKLSRQAIRRVMAITGEFLQ